MSQPQPIICLIATVLIVIASQSTCAASPEPSTVHQVDDPSRDGWATEITQNQVAKIWQELATLIRRDAMRSSDVTRWVAKSFRGTPLRPSGMIKAFDDGTVMVNRSNRNLPEVKTQIGVKGFISSCESLNMMGRKELQHQFKIYRITEQGNQIETRQHIMFAGRSSRDRREVHAVWVAHWQRSNAEKDSLKLASLEVVQYEESVSQSQPLFTDCTEDVLGSNACLRDQLSFSIDYWSNRLLQVDSSGMQGCAIGDANGDGLDDVYLCQSSWLPNRLFLQTEDGRAVEAGAESGVDWHEQSHGALFVDLDNDGDQDLVISTTLGLLLMENQGTGKFTLRHTATEASGAYSIAAADYDSDGNLDIFCCVYIPRALRRQILAAPVPIHDARNGGRNVLLRNDGRWNFSDVTRKTGLEPEASRRSFACSWEDYDNDGDADLYVANDYGRNNLFRNDDGIFTNVANEAGVEDQSFGMSSSWGDVNRDGWMDLYVANMFSAAGNRIVYQTRFRPGDSPETRSSLQYMARGNSLFFNQSNGKFLDMSQDSNVMLGLWSWACPFVDVNNDGNEDILVANGYYTRTDTRDL